MFKYKIFTTSVRNQFEVRIYDSTGKMVKSQIITAVSPSDAASQAQTIVALMTPPPTVSTQPSTTVASTQPTTNIPSLSNTASNIGNATYTYYITTTSTSKTITVLKNNLQIHTSTVQNPTTSNAQLVKTAIFALQNTTPLLNKPALLGMQQISAPQSTQATAQPTGTPTPTPQTGLVRQPTTVAAISKPKKPKPAGKGLEALLTNLSKQVASLESSIDNIFYGKTYKNTGIKFPGAKKKVNGILPIAKEIAKIDLCNIINYVLSNIPVSDLLSNTGVGKKLKALQDKAKNLLTEVESGNLTAKALKSIDKKNKITNLIKEISEGIDTEAISVAPQLAIAKNYLNDVLGSYNQYTNLNTIPNAEVQRLLNKVRGIQSIATSMTTLNSVQDVLNVVNKVGKVNINASIDRLQKAINPAQIIPLLRKLSNTLRGINQIGLKILGFIKVIQTAAKAMRILNTTLEVIRQILSLIPIPNIITIVAITQKLSNALQKIEAFIDKVKKRIAQILDLVDLIYGFILGIVSKIGELKLVVDTIITNLQVCEKIDETIGTDLQQSASQISSTVEKLNKFIADFTNSQANTGEQLYNGYRLTILEEELVDEGIEFKRRKAVAFDSRGVLVAETQLTFATDLQVLYDELILIMKQKGLLTNQPFQVATLLDEVGEVPNDYEDIGLSGDQELIETAGDVSVELSSFIGGLKKGGRRFKRRIRQLTSQFATQSAQKLKSDAKTGKFQPSNRTNNQGSLQRPGTQTSTGEKPNPNLLTPSQRRFWEGVSASTTSTPALKAKARSVLEKDRVARQQAEEED